MTEPTAAPEARTISLTPAELDLLRTALRLLESALGREEADELDEVKALLARLETPAS
ncbi:MAG TPA: hypothetical protein VFS32_01940 [Candidatus Limnocylindrales bacterium]|nr:hypothetical protein [Candidatus Limnocylindrales bacterium]